MSGLRLPEAAIPGPASYQQRLDGLLHAARIINSCLSLNQVLNSLLQQGTSLLRAEGGSVLLTTDDPNRLELAASMGPRAREIQQQWRHGEHSIARWLLLKGKPLRICRQSGEPEVVEMCHRSDVRDSLLSPLRDGKQIIGLLCLNNSLFETGFAEDDLQFLVALADHAAAAVRNARNFELIRRQQLALKELVKEVAAAEADERRRLALMLHDGPAQDAVAVVQTADRLLQVLRKSGADEGTLELAQRSADIARRAVTSVRTVMSEARGGAVVRGTLAAGLVRTARLAERRSGIKVHLHAHSREENLGQLAVSVLLRIVDEALTNVWKHSGAAEAHVTLRDLPDALLVIVEDNGAGFRSLPHTGRGMGMATMAERAALLGASFRVDSTPGSGTRIEIELPHSVEGELDGDSSSSS